jgi:hypothetical protein
VPRLATPDERLRLDANADRDEFVAGFRRSKRGNLWCEYGGSTLTIISRGELFRWCCWSATGPTYSDQSYVSEGEAVEALATALGVGTY